MMDEKKYTEEGKIVNHNTNCQVFNGPISGSIFAMPGSHVDNHPVQTVGADGSAKVEDEGPKADDDRLLIPIPGDLPVVIMNAPELTIKQATNTFVIRTIQDAGLTCKDPWHYACLMAVCDDHGILVDPRAVLKTVHYLMGVAMLACATLHASLTLRLMRPMGTKRPWFVRMAWLLLLLLAAAGVTGLLKLALPVKIPHLGLIHYWAGVMLTLSAAFHLSIALPWLVAKYRKRMT